MPAPQNHRMILCDCSETITGPAALWGFVFRKRERVVFVTRPISASYDSSIGNAPCCIPSSLLGRPCGLSERRHTHRRTCCTAASPSKRCDADRGAQGSSVAPSCRSAWVGGIRPSHHPHFGFREPVVVQILPRRHPVLLQKDQASDRLHTCSAHVQLTSCTLR